MEPEATSKRRAQADRGRPDLAGARAKDRFGKKRLSPERQRKVAEKVRSVLDCSGNSVPVAGVEPQHAAL